MTRKIRAIFGASSAVGRAMAEEACVRGEDVFLIGRDKVDGEAIRKDLSIKFPAIDVRFYLFDAANFASHDALITKLIEDCGEGAFYPVILFADMPEQAKIDETPDLALRCVNISLTGAISVLHRIAPHLEKRGRGQVIVFGSVAGDRGRIKNYVYGGAKAGLAAYCSGLRNRLFRAGVTLTFIKPGFIDTRMTFTMKLPPLPIASSERMAKEAYAAADKGREEVYIPGLWRWVMAIIRNIPEKVFKRLSI